MTTPDYVALGIVVIPLWFLSVRRGQIGGRTFRAMVADLEARGIRWERGKLRAALFKWSRKPASALALCEDDSSREIVSHHADAATAQMKPWKRAATIWMFVGIAGVVAWLFFESKEVSNQAAQTRSLTRPV
jgi:hypothetical protein